MPGSHAIAVLLITLAVFYLYTRSWVRMEIVSLSLLLALVLIFYVFPYGEAGTRITETEVLQAFGHPALVAICSLMILGRGLTMTGALEPTVRFIARVWRWSNWFGLLFTLVVAAMASGFVNDTPVLVLMLPILLSLSERTGFPASKSLMPVNFAILAGGMLTSIGTSTNLLVLSIATDLGMKPMGIFDFAPIAGMSLLVALPYLWLVAPRLLRDRSDRSSPALRKFEAPIVVTQRNTRLLGRSLDELNHALCRPLPLVGVLRDGERIAPDALGVIRSGDRLFLQDTPAGLREIASALRAELYEPSGAGRFVDGDTTRVDLGLAEVVLGTGSDLVGSSLKDARFAAQHRAAVVGLSRNGERLLQDVDSIADVTLAAGDVLLVLASEEDISRLRAVPDLLLLESSLSMPRSSLAPWALGIMGAVVLVAATKLLPIHVAAFIGVIAMLLARCVRLHGLGPALSLEVVLLVASSVALGHSLVSTGAAAWVAQGVTVVVQLVPPAAQIAVFMLFAAILTNFVSNSAAAAVGTPIAIATAQQLGSPLEPFVLAILFGANLSYATPMAYQTNMLVMNAARYDFADFLRVGIPLVLLMLVTLSYLLARSYGL